MRPTVGLHRAVRVNSPARNVLLPLPDTRNPRQQTELLTGRRELRPPTEIVPAGFASHDRFKTGQMRVVIAISDQF